MGPRGEGNVSAVRVRHIPNPFIPGRSLCGAWRTDYWSDKLGWPPCRHCHLRQERK